jgi:ketopantoate reductase
MEDLPENIVLFRKIINHVKRRVLENNGATDESEECVQRIKQFGNVILSLLKNPNEDTKECQSVAELFKKHEFDIHKLSDSDKALCKHYVINDVHTYVFDLNPSRFD